VGTVEGETVGSTLGLVVGKIVGSVVGKAVGDMVGTTVGEEVGENVSGLNTAWHITHVRLPSCSPTDITVTVSDPCTVSSVVH
jgi:outer membrane lipoprotein SlyB